VSRSKRIRHLKIVLVFVLAIAGAACTAAPQADIGGTVRVMGSWSGREEESFLAMVKPFEAQTGITVEYTGTRNLSAALWQGVATGEPPDVAGLPGPGQMAEFAREGALKDLAEEMDVARYKAETVPAFIELGTVDGRLVGAFIKATLKGLIWYNPRMYTLETPVNWIELQSRAELAARGDTQTWCVGLESQATSGWPGTDWIEDVVLRQSGPDVYDDWTEGRVRWTSTEIRKAFEFYGDIIEQSLAGPSGVIATTFEDGGNPLFEDPPGCLFHHQGTFMTEFFKSRAGARDGEYDFFNFPVIDQRFANSVTGAGDLFGMFTDTPQAKALMEYLLTSEAQSIWVSRGGALSVNTRVTDYPDDISRRAAEVLTGAERFRFDASDLMPEAMATAFLQAVLDYTRSPTTLDSILASLDAVQATAYSADQTRPVD
jgi:alpha-glucoside transport system substrate-binding protein